jgi:hypothetical protein
MKCISRREAIEQGLSKYFTGKVCKSGHLSKRDTVSATCMECKREWAKNQRKTGYTKEYLKKRYHQSRALINRYKRMTGCKECGYKKSYSALKFRYPKDMDNKFRISELSSCSKVRIKECMAKGELLCANCYREKYYPDKKI